MGDSTYIHLSHNVSNLVYHIVTPTKYRRLAITDLVEESLRQICEGIELRWDWIRFLEVGADGDHVHFLVQSTPEHSPTEIVRTIKSVTAKRIFAEHPEVKRMLWGGEFWGDGYFVSSVGKFTSEEVIAEYVKRQGNPAEYRQLVLNLSTRE
ncbi:IS200/IS605 family transposase [Sphaerochaeta halotolerans]|jgi:REP element-mobilizing transposase RayT|uniref:IS200/IS605 family transposase n=1 Tax=Sphaerochaeta halotolerans TaxID=2293840 RepID=A0A372ME70_9SPIR|nr:IS200/IS605 family transposase [Sphaerochaeta halotolerans]RFU94089.1 IS200/IS605 family transposase [Sphaerochaeta halotolerans]